MTITRICGNSVKVFLYVFLFLLFTREAYPQENLLPQEETDKVAASSVLIICNGGVNTGSGSIVAVSKAGRVLILTTLDIISPNYKQTDNSKSLDFYDKIIVKLPGNKTPVTANILRQFIDVKTHLALIGVKPEAPPTEVMIYDRSGKVKPGQTVASLAFSDSGQYVALKNNVVTLNERFLKTSSLFPVISTGGPVLNEKGKIIGIITSDKTRKPQRGNAVRIKTAAHIVNTWLNEMSGLELTWHPKGLAIFSPWVIGTVIATGGAAGTVMLLSGDDSGGFPKPPLRPGGN